MKLKHYLIASEENDYNPWITTKTALACFILLVWGIRLIVPASITSAQSTIDPSDVMDRINSERTSRLLPALATNSKLIVAAAAKSNDMIERSYFAHIDPDGNYVWPRIVGAGYQPYVRLGENLAMDFVTASGVVSAWMNSPTHRANIVNDKFEDQGLTATYGNYEPYHDTIMVVSLFGTLQKKSTNSSTPANTPPASTSPPKPTPTPSPSPTLSASPSPTQGVSGDNTEKVAVNIQQGLTGASTPIPIAPEAKTSRVIRIIFGVLALIYMLFLAIDSLIIHRAKLNRNRMPSSPHTLLLLLIAAASFISVLT